MSSIDPIRRFAILIFLCSGIALAQSTLPVTPSTAPAPATSPSQSATAPVIARAVNDANVSYAQGQIEISADNSSLNQILQEIGRVTGMTITGSVADQRVFGVYGPATPSEILTILLQGTGTNIMMLNTASNAPAKLILTPQQGGPSPPASPSPDGDPNVDANVPTVLTNGDRSWVNVSPPIRHPSRSEYIPPTLVPQPAPASASANSGSNPAPSPVPANNPTSPNGVQTPQQIYQQLMQLQNAPTRR